MFQPLENPLEMDKVLQNFAQVSKSRQVLVTL